jgi:hypothetical protein|tara:strand:+ start:1944 stop:2075 length:132 start_codon:yes stop_codon:yes gene_type:complete
MGDWQKWVIVLAGLVALAGQWVTGYYLAAIGGAVAAIVGLMLE